MLRTGSLFFRLANRRGVCHCNRVEHAIGYTVAGLANICYRSRVGVNGRRGAGGAGGGGARGGEGGCRGGGVRWWLLRPTLALRHRVEEFVEISTPMRQGNHGRSDVGDVFIPVSFDCAFFRGRRNAERVVQRVRVVRAVVPRLLKEEVGGAWR